MKAFSKFLRSLVATSRPPEGTVLSPDDFPLTVIGTKLSKPDGAPVAIATDTDTAKEIAERLNNDELRNEEDKWSA